MPHDEVTINVLPALAQGDKVCRVELERRSHVKRDFVVDVYFLSSITKRAPWILF